MIGSSPPLAEGVHSVAERAARLWLAVPFPDVRDGQPHVLVQQSDQRLRVGLFQWPFERAQLRLDCTEWLRQQRRINEAKPILTEVLATFRRLRTQIVRLASEGLTNREIADRLFLSPRTVGSHLYRSYSKLGVPVATTYAT